MRDYVLTVFIFSLLPVCLVRPWVGVIVWYWVGMMNPHRLTWTFAFSMPFALWIGGATLLGALFAKDRKPVPWNRELVLVMVLLAYFTVTTAFFAWAPGAAWQQLEKVSKIILMTLVATMFIYGRNRVRTLLLTVALSIGFYGVKGALWVFRTGGSERVMGPEQSFLEGNTFIGLGMNMVLPLLIFLARTEQRTWMKRALYGTAGLTVVAIIFTYSRGAYLGLLVILPLLFLGGRTKVVAASILIPVVFLAPMVLPEKVFHRAAQIENYQDDSSANMRLGTWNLAWNLAKDNPLTGAGFEFEYTEDPAKWYRYLDQEYSRYFRGTSVAHSIYFQLLGHHGFIALFVFLAVMIGTLLSLQRIKSNAQSEPDAQWIWAYASGIQLGLIGYLVNGSFLNSAYFDLVWLYVALSPILARELKSIQAQTRAIPVSGDHLPLQRQQTKGASL